MISIIKMLIIVITIMFTGICYTENNFDKKTNIVIEEAVNKYDLFFFYMDSCPVCHVFAKYFKSFIERDGWNVIAVSLDGIDISEFPSNKKYEHLAKELNITLVPCIYISEKNKKKYSLVNIGLKDEKGISDKVKKVLTVLEGKDL